MEKKYQLYKAKVPGEVMEKFQVYALRMRPRLLRDLVSMAVAEHIEAVQEGKREAVLKQIGNSDREQWTPWTLSIDVGAYKAAQKLKIDMDVEMFDLVASALLAHVEAKV